MGKLCKSCKEVKSLTDFRQTRGKYYQANCKKCDAEQQNKRREYLRENGPSITHQYKICPACKVNKSIDDFHLLKTAPDGHDTYCKECKNASRMYYHNKHRQNGPSVFRDKKKCYICDEEKLISEFGKKSISPDGYAGNCKQCESMAAKDYRYKLKNQKKIIPKSKKCSRCKLIKPSTDFYKSSSRPDGLRPECKNCEDSNMSNKIRRSVRQAINLYSTNGKTKAAKLYGIDVSTIVESLGKKPSKEHVVDHIIPISAFDYNNELHIAASWHPKNLRWITDTENLQKGAKYTEAEFTKYMEWFMQTIVENKSK